ncbi:MAG TPA: glycoside hydrolase domain-containing protein, partial [Myxococcaceae bacterium]|nr:glycoside hydrolase domain-containing protein [Myxococcaceae bacterium]
MIRRGGSTCFLVAVLLGAGTASAVTVVDATQKVRPGDSVSGASAAVLRAARNEFAPFQIVVEGGSAGRSSVSASASPLVGPSGTLPALQVRLYRVGYLNLTTPSNDEGGTGRWPDPLIPDVDEVVGEKRNAFPFNVPAWENRVIFVDLHVPRDTVPGVYTGTVTVSSPGSSETVPITLRVLDFEIPATSTMPNTYGINWGSACWAHYGSVDACGGDAGIIRMNTMYARYMLDHRITGEVVYIAPRWTGSSYDWENTFVPHYAEFLDGNSDGMLLEGAQVTSLRYRGPREASRYAEWARYFRTQGWFGRTYDYTCDEPPMTCAWSDIPVRASLVRQGDPEMRTLVTTNIVEAVEHGADDDIDILVPVVNHMHDRAGSRFEGNQRTSYEAFLQSSPQKELWWYQCCMSHGCGYIGGPETYGWPSYMIDASGVQNRAMQWLTFSYGIRGELYYEALHQLPNAWNSVFDFGGNGDGTLLYPGTPARIGGTTHVPVSSYRLKMIREGMEDYEYLQQLVKLGDPAFAHDVARGLFPTAYEARQPVAKLREARDLVIGRIVELTTPRLSAAGARDAIVIDGDLTEFADAPMLGLSGAEIGSDGSAQVRAMWDRERLYLAWAVTDATQRINEGGADGDVWNGDGVEVMIDASANG